MRKASFTTTCCTSSKSFVCLNTRMANRWSTYTSKTSITNIDRKKQWHISWMSMKVYSTPCCDSRDTPLLVVIFWNKLTEVVLDDLYNDKNVLFRPFGDARWWEAQVWCGDASHAKHIGGSNRLSFRCRILHCFFIDFALLLGCFSVAFGLVLNCFWIDLSCLEFPSLEPIKGKWLKPRLETSFISSNKGNGHMTN